MNADDRPLPRSLGHALEQLLGNAEYKRLIEVGRQAPPEHVDLVCPRCKGAGWLWLDLPSTAHDFGRIVECQCGIVAARRAERFLGASRIPAEYADLDLSTYPDRHIASDVTGWWRELPSPWLLLVGDRGVGKTGLTIGLVKAAVADSRSALFRPAPDLMSDIRATYQTRDGTSPAEAEMVGALKTIDVLAIDDLGAVRMTGWAQERLYEVLNHRYNERRRTIVTTDMGPDELRDHVGERIYSRVVGMGWRYEILGRNLRLAR